MLDGYVVEAIAEPRAGNETEAFMASVHAVVRRRRVGGVGRRPQAAPRRALDRPRHAATPGEEMRGALPISAGRVVVLFASRVAAFDPARSTWTTLIDAEASRPRRLRHDDPRLLRRALDRRGARPRPPRRPARTSAGRPTRPPGSTDFDFPLPGDDGELFAAAVDARTRHKVAVRLAGGRYQRVFDVDQGAARVARPARLDLGARRARGRGG